MAQQFDAASIAINELENQRNEALTKAISFRINYEKKIVEIEQAHDIQVSNLCAEIKALKDKIEELEQKEE